MLHYRYPKSQASAPLRLCGNKFGSKPGSDASEPLRLSGRALEMEFAVERY